MKFNTDSIIISLALIGSVIIFLYHLRNRSKQKKTAEEKEVIKLSKGCSFGFYIFFAALLLFFAIGYFFYVQYGKS